MNAQQYLFVEANQIIKHLKKSFFSTQHSCAASVTMNLELRKDCLNQIVIGITKKSN